ncbi:hypothetical protein ABT369_39255 [Dactylosporangium sp. NPDC000244]|uniref:hypothetical protein n=1 Tax=Dactylosporangium sp. NPDC000244 TaxID=3154365 RepID=UPI0033222E7E
MSAVDEFAAVAVLSPEDAATAAGMLAALHERGYRTVEAHGDLRPGTRIRHRGDQWSAAYANGTGIVLVITEKPNSSWSVSWRLPDVELIALWDRPDTRGRFSQLAQYHVDVIGGAR